MACKPCIFSPGWRAALLVVVASLGLEAPAVHAAGVASKDDVAKANPVSFHRDILPMLQAHCQGCHQPAKAGGELDLTSFKNLLGQGESGLVAIVPGKPNESNLLEQITPQNGEAAMPKDRKPLADSEVALIRRWIEEGAKDDTPASTVPPVDVDHPPVYHAAPVITSVDWSPNGSLLAVAGFHEVLLHKADGSGLVARLVGMSPRIESVRFSPDGKKLAVTGGSPAQMGEVQIWSVADGELLVSKPVTNDVLFGASWSADGKRVAFGGTDKAVRAIDAETGEQVLFQASHDDWVLGTAFSTDGSFLVSVGRDMAAKLVEVATQRFVDNITSITPGALKGGIQSVVRHPLRDEIIFGGSDGTPRIYRMQRVTARQIGDDANQLWELPSLPGRIFSVDITADARTIAAGSSLDGHGYVHVYRMEATPKIPDGIQAILNKPVQQRSAEETATLRKHFEQGVEQLATIEVAKGGVYAIALSPSGDRVAAAGADGTVRVFETDKGSPLASFVPVEIKKVDDAAIAKKASPVLPSQAPLALPSDPTIVANGAVSSISVDPVSIRLDGPARYAQLVVTAQLSSGAKIDVTRQAKLTFSTPIASVDAAGLVMPKANGHASLQIDLKGKLATVDVEVVGLDVEQKPDYIRDIGPILARAGCNQGTCHGAQAGKNGFKLSLRGYDPLFDVRALTDDLASRRVNIASPAESLMLLKPTASVPHTGGQVIKPGSAYYEALRAWVADGAQLNPSSPRVTGIKIVPQNPVIEAIGSHQQMRVVATYSDGSERDVTREAFLESGNTDCVKTVPDQAGLVEALRRGEAAVLVRYEGNYAATTLTVMGDRAGFAWEKPAANNKIDDLVFAKLQRTKTLPSPLTNDYEFVRRVYLDLTGLPPTPEQTEAFVSDKSENKAKRAALIDKLVGSNDYIDYWTNKWADLLMVNRKFLGVEGATAYRNWIRGEVAANTPYDEFARKIITATGSNKENPAGSYYKALRTPTALMENTTHLFLATRFNCNKCHDHPFERWTQNQYYQLSAYFAQVQLTKDPEAGDRVVAGNLVEAATPLFEIVGDSKEGEVTHVRTGQVTAPEFPFPCEHEEKAGATRREKLASWLTSPDNPYFAMSYVNRLWGYLNGRGIIEPLDDIRAGNPPTNPELLDYLTKEFIDSGFNTRHVVSLICKSRTYQASVETNKWNEDDQINFSHARARRLPAEVLYDAIYRTTGATSSFAGVAPGTRAATLPDVGVELPDGFLGNLGRPARESACECERSSNLQLGPVMALVSGPTVGNAISDPQNRVAKMVAKVSDNSELVNRLFLRFLSRPANDDEVEAATQLFDELKQDHAQLVKRLQSYEQELAPTIAERELERQNRVAGLQAELEVYRALVKLKQPRAEQHRRSEIEKAQAALAKYDAELAAKLPDWESAQKAQTHWTTLTPIEMSASFNSRLKRQSDGSIFVEGDKAKGSYRLAAPIPLERVTGIRLEALADDRLPNRGPGRGNGNFVVTEFVARSMRSASPERLVRNWDFSGGDDDWQVEDGAKVVADSGMRHIFGTSKPAGIKTTLKLPAGVYLLDVATGVHSATSISVQWTTDKATAFDGARQVRRNLPASAGGSLSTLIPIESDGELTSLRIVVDGEQAVLPIDAVRLFASDAGYASIKLQNAKADFSQGGYAIETAIDGNTSAESGNGWAIAPQLGQNHVAAFELAAPLKNASSRTLELMIHQRFVDGQHSLGKFRLSITDSPAPLNFGLPGEISAILAKPADKRTNAEREALLARFRAEDKGRQEFVTKLAEAKKPIPADPQLKKLEADLAVAQQPLSIDQKLQQLRRAVALSEDQMKNKRLTIAQDIVWALINNPGFLYNH